MVAYMPPVSALNQSRAEQPRKAAAAPARRGGPVPPSAIADSASVNAKRWMTARWLFLVEPLGPGRCRVFSRYRCATSDDLASRLQFGPVFVEPVSFAMDRRMLIGIKQRAEHMHR
jgi:hypothetical protein